MGLKLVLAISAVLAAASAAPTLAAEAAAPKPVAAIPGVIAEGAQWEAIYKTPNGADGIVGLKDGSILSSQERTALIWRIDGHDNAIWASETHGAGSLGIDQKGRVWGVERTCTDPARKGPPCTEWAMVGIEGPGTFHQMVSNMKPDGTTFGRPLDLALDVKGGAYVADGPIYYVKENAKTIAIDESDIKSNGIMVSPDGKTLYASNQNEMYQYDIQPDGSVKNKRKFGTFDDTNTDGMAIDAQGRLYETGAHGIHVYSPDGRELGIIPSPTGRRPTSLCFAGPDKKTLFLVEVGAVDDSGALMTSPNARTIYRIPTLTQGYLGRAK
jgi:gluconolactonase